MRNCFVAKSHQRQVTVLGGCGADGHCTLEKKEPLAPENVVLDGKAVQLPDGDVQLLRKPS